MNGAFLLKMKQRIFIKLSYKSGISKGGSLTATAPLHCGNEQLFPFLI